MRSDQIARQVRWCYLDATCPQCGHIPLAIALAIESPSFAFCGRVYLDDGRVLVFLWGRLLWVESQ